MSGPKSHHLSPAETPKPPSGAETSQACPSGSWRRATIALSQCPQQVVCPLGEGIASHHFPRGKGSWMEVKLMKNPTEAVSVVP